MGTIAEGYQHLHVAYFSNVECFRISNFHFTIYVMILFLFLFDLDICLGLYIPLMSFLHSSIGKDSSDRLWRY